MLVDTHAHLNFKAFKDDYRETIDRAFESGVCSIVTVGSDFKTSSRAVKIAAECREGVHAAVGIHPVSVDRVRESASEIERLKDLARSSKIVAIGETGLDFYHNREAKEQQMVLLQAMVDLADELDLPLIIHCREAFPDLLRALKSAVDRRGHRLRGVVHCFSGTVEQAKEVLDLGLLISFTGNITYAEADEQKQVVAEIPLAKMMVETDSPFLAPVPYRGTRNEPAYVVEVADEIAKTKSVSRQEVSRATTENARKLFDI